MHLLLQFSSDELDANKFGEQQQGRIEPEQYYRRLGLARVGLAVPGVGYDTFRCGAHR